MSIDAYDINVKGVVQGVGFRYYTKLKADELGLSGTVENREDGSVFIWVEGKEEPINKFLDWCHAGPATANVDALEYKNQTAKGFDSFEIIRR